MTQAVIKVLSTRTSPGGRFMAFLAVVTVAHSLQGGLGWAVRPRHLSTESWRVWGLALAPARDLRLVLFCPPPSLRSGNHSGFPPSRPACIPVTPHTPRVALTDTLPTKNSFRHPGSQHRSGSAALPPHLILTGVMYFLSLHSPYLQIPHLTNFS
ncbi:hypothetical protein F5J12DRAFT_863225 [Pisolithus orientalis]|uniref:uncharacterized protein n=1 Tax=Pisolithus orientalis TaxID=936130 RepID=UPI00222433FB|nr:uncharacterized protein F5J12DRAFT_863225 [Pisolithus orientalis]KAI5990313.1 hypothetical protein F5J12DRAFT_863225 [Pisolithus orientalis]